MQQIIQFIKLVHSVNLALKLNKMKQKQQKKITKLG